MNLLKRVRSDVATQIRRMPDFIIQPPQTKEVFFTNAVGAKARLSVKPTNDYRSGMIPKSHADRKI